MAFTSVSVIYCEYMEEFQICHGDFILVFLDNFLLGRSLLYFGKIILNEQ